VTLFVAENPRGMMEPRMETRAATTLIGMHNRAGSEGTTSDLWRRFLPRRSEIRGRVDDNRISMRVFHRADDEPLGQQTPVDEWAVVEVSAGTEAPEGMEVFELPGGTYAVFLHRGLPSALPETLGHVFGTWLPSSPYELDNRPHLAVMGPGYTHDDPDAEEELWIPVVQT
jgi:AraC family transcriptional regulator